MLFRSPLVRSDAALPSPGNTGYRALSLRSFSGSLWWAVSVLEKTLESPMDCKEIQLVHSKGDQSWVFFGRNDAKAETPILWPPHAKI